MAKILRENLNTKAYAALKKMIGNYYFKPGERINVEKIAKELEISRTPVWEAIRRLEQEGLVFNSPNKQGVYMHALTLEEALDLIAVREVLESMAARLAAKKINEKTLLKLDKLLEKQRKIVENEDIVAYAQVDTDFHTLVYESTGNEFLCELLRNIHSKLRPMSMHAGDFIRNFYEDHVEIVNALRSHDLGKVEEKFRKHTQDIMGIIRSGEMTFITPGVNGHR